MILEGIKVTASADCEELGQELVIEATDWDGGEHVQTRRRYVAVACTEIWVLSRFFKWNR